MTIQKRSIQVEKLARIYDDEIAPIWASRFGKMLLRNLVLPEKSQVLDVSCGTGYPSVEILRRLTDGSRLIAIDPAGAMLDVARRKVAELGPLGKKGVFFRTESAVPKLSFANDVYDLVVCNLGIGEMPSLAEAVADFARVAKPGGEVRCTLPLAGSFAEFHDIYREVLIKHDKHEALERLDRYQARYPTLEQCEAHMAQAGLTTNVEVETFSLLFKSSREFFFAPVIEYGPLPDWKAVAGVGQEMQDIFWYIKEAIDAYFVGRPFEVTIVAGCMVGKKQEPTARQHAVPARAPSTDPALFIDVADTSEFEDEDTDVPARPSAKAMAAGSVRKLEGSPVGEGEAHDTAEQVGELEIEAELDALVEGRPRPPHLDD